MDDDFEQKMQKMALAREELQTRLSDSEQKLQDIDAKMDEMARRQKARMKADTRVNDKVLENFKMTEEKKKIFGLKKPVTAQPDERTQMITRELTAEDITVTVKLRDEPESDTDDA